MADGLVNRLLKRRGNGVQWFVMAKKQKIRVDFRKNRTQRTRINNWTRQFEEHGFKNKDHVPEERISGKGDVVRRRTIVAELDEPVNVENAPKESTLAKPDFLHQVNVRDDLLEGRVIRVFGASSEVAGNNGTVYSCTTRRLLKTLATDQRQPVVTGDFVRFRPVANTSRPEGMIERVETRHGVVSRESKNRKHLLVTNVDQMLIVASAEEPPFKPNLIDRMLLSAEQSNIKPMICINKIDLVDPAELMPTVGVYAQIGYKVVLLSTVTRLGVDRLRLSMQNRTSVVVGQSGVGKSSILNAVMPGLDLKVSEVSKFQKGRHTTSTAELFPLPFGGYVVDTPGIRQFLHWDIIPEEVFGLFRDLRPYENLCRFPNCTHDREEDCAVKDALADGRLDFRRYENYLAIRAGKND